MCFKCSFNNNMVGHHRRNLSLSGKLIRTSSANKVQKIFSFSFRQWIFTLLTDTADSRRNITWISLIIIITLTISRTLIVNFMLPSLQFGAFRFPQCNQLFAQLDTRTKGVFGIVLLGGWLVGNLRGVFRAHCYASSGYKMQEKRFSATVAYWSQGGIEIMELAGNDEPLDLSLPKIQKNKLFVVQASNNSKPLLECEFCNKTFDRPSLLKRHRRTHTGKTI